MPELIIEADRIERQYWSDLWRYRELFLFFVWRDLLVRYKQTIVGVSWSLIRPLLTVLVLTVVFGRLSKMPTGGYPYPAIVLCGMLPWQFFSSAMSECGNSLVSNSNMISKVYFPRLVITVSSVITSLTDFFIASIFFIVMMAWYRITPPIQIVALPAFIFLVVGAAVGVGVWLAALMVEYRDFRFIVPFLVQFGLYLSPVGFQTSVVPVQYRLLYSLNPMVGIIDGFRWSLLGSNSAVYWPGVALAFLEVVWLLGSGIWYFRRTERTFADVI